MSTKYNYITLSLMRKVCLMPSISLRTNLGITKRYALSQSMPFHGICLMRESTVYTLGPGSGCQSQHSPSDRDWSGKGNNNIHRLEPHRFGNLPLGHTGSLGVSKRHLRKNLVGENLRKNIGSYTPSNQARPGLVPDMKSNTPLQTEDSLK